MFKRVVLKLSGEALRGDSKYGISPSKIKSIAKEIKEGYDLGVEIILIIGAGNIWRGKIGEDLGMDRAQADYMGMLATIMNALAVQDGLESVGVPTRVMTAFSVHSVAEPYIRRRAFRHLEKKRVIIIAGGTGSPFFSTDSAAALRAAELNAEVVLMAKNGVSGVFDSDPKINKDAMLFSKISHEEILRLRLQVMDLTAAAMCSQNDLNIIVFDMNVPGNIKKAMAGNQIGTLVYQEEK